MIRFLSIMLNKWLKKYCEDRKITPGGFVNDKCDKKNE